MQASIESLTAMVEHVPALLRELSEDNVGTKAAPEKWSKKELLGHLIDSAFTNQHRFAAGQYAKEFEAIKYVQDPWVKYQNYQGRSWTDLVELWTALNAHLLHVIKNMDEASLDHTAISDYGKPCTLLFLVQDYAQHLKYHMGQIVSEEDLKAKGGDLLVLTPEKREEVRSNGLIGFNKES